MTGGCASRTSSPPSRPTGSIRWVGTRRSSSSDRTAAAVLHQIFLIGEAVARLPEEIRRRAPDVPWEEIIGMRNIIAHGYFEMDLEVPWKTVRLDLPTLREHMRSLLDSDDS